MRNILIAVLVAFASPALAAELWIDESGDFYLEKSDVDLAMFSEMEDEFPRTYCESDGWVTKGHPIDITCDNGSTYRLELVSDDVLLVNGTKFFKV